MASIPAWLFFRSEDADFAALICWTRLGNFNYNVLRGMPQGLAVYHNGVFQKRLQSVVRAMTGRFAQTCLFVETDGTVMKCSGEDTKQRGMFSLDLLETPYSILAGMPCTFCGFEQKERMNFAPAPTMMTTHFYVLMR